LVHYNDIDVTNLSTFNSYTERRLDKSTTWDIDTDIKVLRVVDPDDPSKINGQTPIVQNFGKGINSYNISR